MLFDYSYELVELSKDKLDNFMKTKSFKAINVTIPYKEAVIPYLDEISETAKKIGAVNTIVNENGYLKGYNTDFSGMVALFKKNNITVEGKKVLILGSGGTSKTALAVCESLGCREVFRVSRNGKEDCITYQEAKQKHIDAEIIINTTPVGMYPDIYHSPIEIDDYPNLVVVVDAVYNPLRSKLVCDAKSKGIKAVGGLYMLVAQAAVAAEKFINKKVNWSDVDRIYQTLLLKKSNIVLIGMPGSGKTTIGKLLAEDMGYSFIDTDEEIIKLENKSITEIFSNCGEAGFREIEAEVIKSVAINQGTVISTGGGAVLNPSNIDILRENGKIYFIDRPLESLVATSDRPLSSNRGELEKRYNERYPVYCTACDKHIKISDNAEDNKNIIKSDFYNEDSLI